MPKNVNESDNVVAVDFSRKRSLKTMLSSPKERALNEKKRSLFDKWLSYGAVSMLFDARVQDVKVPEEFADRGDLRLNFSYDFLVPDFSFNDQSVWATLSFDSGEFFCSVPWNAVYGLQSEKLHQGAVWFDSFPIDYDQEKVLGFSEDMCEEFGEPVEATSNDGEDGDTGNVVQLKFTSDRDELP